MTFVWVCYMEAWTATAVRCAVARKRTNEEMSDKRAGDRPAVDGWMARPELSYVCDLEGGSAAGRVA